MDDKKGNIILGIILAILMIIAIAIVIINPNKVETVNYAKEQGNTNSEEVTANTNKTNNEEDYNKINSYKVEIKSLIELIDYILERLYIKKYISKNNINKLGYKLIEINKMSSKWMENKISYASGNK